MQMPKPPLSAQTPPSNHSAAAQPTPPPSSKPRCLVTGGAGFIGSHLAKRLKEEGHHVVVADWRRNSYMNESEFCHEFLHVDLRDPNEAQQAVRGAEWVFHLAADMGGMGFISSNFCQLACNNQLLTIHLLTAARQEGTKRVFYASSACVYPAEWQQGVQTTHQQDPDAEAAISSSSLSVSSLSPPPSSSPSFSLPEHVAWQGRPADVYGREKLMGEELLFAFAADRHFEVRIARFHNIYGPKGCWWGGREKAPAAIARKVWIAAREKERQMAASRQTVQLVGADALFLPSTASLSSPSPGPSVEVWGDGSQLRSFCYIDDAVEGVMRLMHSAYDRPLNIGSDRFISVAQLVQLMAQVSGEEVWSEQGPPLLPLPGPVGVPVRNSDNTLIAHTLGWSPRTTLESGLARTYRWLDQQLRALLPRHPFTALCAVLRASIVIESSLSSLQAIGHVQPNRDEKEEIAQAIQNKAVKKEGSEEAGK